MKTTTFVKSIIAGLALTVSTQVACAQELIADSWADTKALKGGSMVVNYCPEDVFAYTDENGKLTGIEIDLMKLFVHHVETKFGTKLKVEWVETKDFGDFYASVKDAKKGVFGVGAVSRLESREDEVAFTPSYMRNKAVLITSGDVPEMRNIAEFNDHFDAADGVSLRASSYNTYLELLSEETGNSFNTVFVNNNNDIVDHVESNPGSFAFIDLAAYINAVKNGKNVRRHAGFDQASTDFAFIMPKDSDWGEPVNSFFGSSQFKSFMLLVLKKHLGANAGNLMEMIAAKKGTTNTQSTTR